MKIDRIKTALLALAGVALATQIAGAASLSYTAGDLFLGVRATGGTGAAQDYLIDLGQYTQFTSSTPGFTLSLGNLGADLTTIFGSGWNTRSDVLWGIVGTPYNGTNTKVLFASRQRNAVNTQSTAWTGGSPSSQGTTIGYVQGLASGYTAELNSSANSNVGVVQGTSDNNSYASYFTGATFGTLDFARWSTIQGDFGNGTSGSVLDLYQINPVNGQAATYSGNFRFDDSGALFFNVPEPSTTAVLGIGAALLLFFRHRQAAAV